MSSQLRSRINEARQLILNSEDLATHLPKVENPNTDPKTLADLYKTFHNHDDNQQLVYGIAGHPNTPPSVLRMIDKNLVRHATGNRSLSRIIPAFSTDSKYKTGARGTFNLTNILRNNPNTPEDIKDKHKEEVSPYLDVRSARQGSVEERPIKNRK